MDPGTPLKVPVLGASLTHSAGPLAPLYRCVDKEVGQQAESKLEERIA